VTDEQDQTELQRRLELITAVKLPPDVELDGEWPIELDERIHAFDIHGHRAPQPGHANIGRGSPGRPLARRAVMKSAGPERIEPAAASLSDRLAAT